MIKKGDGMKVREGGGRGGEESNSDRRDALWSPVLVSVFEGHHEVRVQVHNLLHVAEDLVDIVTAPCLRGNVHR